MSQYSNESASMALHRDRDVRLHLIEQERRFYVVASILLLIVSIIGFRQFLLHGKSAGGTSISPPILYAVVTHGVVIFSWLLLLLVQSVLIVGGRLRQHMTLGAIGGVLAAAVAISAFVVAPLSAHYNPGSYVHFGGARYFLAFALTAPVMFSILVTVGFVYRKRPDIHRPMMLLATVAMTTGSFDRWPYLEHLIAFTHGYVPVFHWGPMLVLGAVLFLLHAVMTQRPSCWYGAGYAVVVSTVLLSVAIAGSETWQQIAALVVP